MQMKQAYDPISAEDVDLPLTSGSLRTMAQQGLLTSEHYEKALFFMGIRPQASDWGVFWQRILLLSGLLFFIAGVICFFAWNWADMSHFSKFGLIIALILASAAFPLLKGMDSMPGRLGLLACGLLVGPLLAVFGQFYQTGADAWELFRAWAIILVLLAMLGRQNGLWFVAWVISSLFGILYIHQNFLNSWRSIFTGIEFPEFILCQALILIAWEAAIFHARRREGSFLHATWFARVLAVAVVFFLTWALYVLIHAGNRLDTINAASALPVAPLLISLYILLLGGGYYWYRIKRPDTLVLTAMLGSFIFLLFVILFQNFELGTMAGMFFCAVFLMLCAYAAARLVMVWHKAILKNKTASESQDKKWSVHSLNFLKSCSLRALYIHLGQVDPAAMKGLEMTSDSQTYPWFVRIMLTFSAWCSAFFFVGFLTYAIRVVSRASQNGIIVAGSIVFLLIAFFLTRKKGLFRQEFGLALALAGCIGFSYGVMRILHWSNWWQLVALFTACMGFMLTRNASLRCIATLVATLSTLDLIAQFLSMSGYPHTLFLMAISILFFALLALLLAHGWYSEKEWVVTEKKEMMLRPAMLGMAVTFLVVGCLAVFLGRFNINTNHTREGIFIFLLNGSGIGAGIGLCYLAWCISGKTMEMNARKMLIYSGVLAVSIAGWWLPWFPVAVFLLALGRFLGSTALVGLSGVFLAVCVNWYYYSLETPLLYKSYTLCIIGVIMLAFGYAMGRAFAVSPPETVLPVSGEGGNHA